MAKKIRAIGHWRLSDFRQAIIHRNYRRLYGRDKLPDSILLRAARIALDDFGRTAGSLDYLAALEALVVLGARFKVNTVLPDDWDALCDGPRRDTIEELEDATEQDRTDSTTA